MEKKFTVHFASDKTSESLEIMTTESDVAAVQFALFLHQNSNCSHVVTVTEPDSVVPILILG